MEFTNEEKKVLDAYLRAFTSDFGKIVLKDLEKRLYIRRISDKDLESHAKCVERITEQNVYLTILRLLERAADVIQTAEGVTPARTPEVITEEDQDVSF
jgi:hypothetical protein